MDDICFNLGHASDIFLSSQIFHLGKFRGLAEIRSMQVATFGRSSASPLTHVQRRDPDDERAIDPIPR